MSDKTIATVTQVDALVGRVGVPTRDRRTIADLTVHSDPIPVLKPPGVLVGSATAQLTGADGVIARIVADPETARQLLAGELRAHMELRLRRIESNDDGGVILHGGRLTALTLTDGPAAWDGTWVAPVVTG